MAGERRGLARVIVIIINLSWGRHNVNNCYTFATEIKKCQPGVKNASNERKWRRF